MTMVSTCGGFEGGDHLLCHRGGVGLKTGVDHERAATWLIARDDDLAAFGGEHARGGCVDVREEDLLHAAGQACPRAGAEVSTGTTCSRQLIGALRGTAGRRASMAARRLGSSFEMPDGANQRVQADLLIESSGSGEERGGVRDGGRWRRAVLRKRRVGRGCAGCCARSARASAR